MTTTVVRLPALAIRQGARLIYSFAVDGKRLPEIATVSRVRRSEGGHLEGYQRPEALAHVRGIRRYLESPEALLPNALVVAFDQRVRFERFPSQPAEGAVIAGELLVPVDDQEQEEDRPAWIVDGQQRTAAIRDAQVSGFNVAAVGFIAESVQEQRSQFILVNSTKPLPKGLIHELLPDVSGHLSPALARRQLPASVMVRLNDPGSGGPFAGRISSPTAPGGYIKDTSVLKMVEHALYEGSLYQYRAQDGSATVGDLVKHLNVFWGAVRDTWPEEWERTPRESRLTHGVGIVALGYVMDELTEDIKAADLEPERLRASLEALREHTAWSSGAWKFRDGERPWNGLQNTTNDIYRLVRHFQRCLSGKA